MKSDMDALDALIEIEAFLTDQEPHGTVIIHHDRDLKTGKKLWAIQWKDIITDPIGDLDEAIIEFYRKIL